jgi:hypothetical protein
MNQVGKVEQTILLHIGWHKTGTSAIQAFLAANRQRLFEQSGVLYPETGLSGRAHHELAHSLVKPGAVPPGMWPRLAEELDSKSWRTAIISAESLHRADSAAVRVMRDTLSRPWRRIMAVCYLRQPDHYLEASYAQRVKSGALDQDWPEYRDKSVFKGAPNYQQVVDRFRGELGMDAVRLRPYDTTQWPEGSLMRDFFLTPGLEHVSDIGALSEPGRINPTPGKEVLAVLLSLGRRLRAAGITPVSRVFRKMLFQKIMTHLEQRGFQQRAVRFFSAGERRELRTAYAPWFASAGLTFGDMETEDAEGLLPEVDDLPADWRAAIFEVVDWEALVAAHLKEKAPAEEDEPV